MMDIKLSSLVAFGLSVIQHAAAVSINRQDFAAQPDLIHARQSVLMRSASGESQVQTDAQVCDAGKMKLWDGNLNKMTCQSCMKQGWLALRNNDVSYVVNAEKENSGKYVFRPWGDIGGFFHMKVQTLGGDEDKVYVRHKNKVIYDSTHKRGSEIKFDIVVVEGYCKYQLKVDGQCMVRSGSDADSEVAYWDLVDCDDTTSWVLESIIPPSKDCLRNGELSKVTDKQGVEQNWNFWDRVWRQGPESFINKVTDLSNLGVTISTSSGTFSDSRFKLLPVDGECRYLVTQSAVIDGKKIRQCITPSLCNGATCQPEECSIGDHAVTLDAMNLASEEKYCSAGNGEVGDGTCTCPSGEELIHEDGEYFCQECAEATNGCDGTYVTNTCKCSKCSTGYEPTGPMGSATCQDCAPGFDKFWHGDTLQSKCQSCTHKGMVSIRLRDSIFVARVEGGVLKLLDNTKPLDGRALQLDARSSDKFCRHRIKVGSSDSDDCAVLNGQTWQTKSCKSMQKDQWKIQPITTPHKACVAEKPTKTKVTPKNFDQNVVLKGTTQDVVFEKKGWSKELGAHHYTIQVGASVFEDVVLIPMDAPRCTYVIGKKISNPSGGVTYQCLNLRREDARSDFEACHVNTHRVRMEGCPDGHDQYFDRDNTAQCQVTPN